MTADAAGSIGSGSGKAPVHLWIVGVLALLWNDRANLFFATN